MMYLQTKHANLFIQMMKINIYTFAQLFHTNLLLAIAVAFFKQPKFNRNTHTHQAKEKRLLSKSIRLQVSHLLINKQHQQKQKSNYVVFDRSKDQNFCIMNVPSSLGGVRP